MNRTHESLAVLIEEHYGLASRAETECVNYTILPRRTDGPDEEYDDASERLASYTELLSDELCMLAEVLQLPQAAKNFRKQMMSFRSYGELTHRSYEDDLYAPALRKAYTFFRAMQRVIWGSTSPRIATFEAILRNTAKVALDVNLEPANEGEIRRLMFRTIGYAFPDCAQEVTLNNTIKNYQGDIGVPSLGAVAEYKFASNKDKAKQCLDGIYADMKGYQPQGKYNRFYAVFYFSQPFFVQQDLDQAFLDVRSEKDWIPIVVHDANSKIGKETSKNQRSPRGLISRKSVA